MVYNVIFETNEEIVSEFQVRASNIKEAKRIAQMHKRHHPNGRQCRTRVYKIND